MRLLVVSTWFPYPPATGAKSRAHHLLRALAERHEIALVSFRDGPIEPAWVTAVRTVCRRVEIVERHPFEVDRVRSLLGWASPRPRALVATESAAMYQRVARVAAEWRATHVVGLAGTAHYVLALPVALRPFVVIDLDNFMARALRDEWRRDAGASRLRRWAAWRKYRRHDAAVVRRADVVLAVSRADADVARQLGGGDGARVELIPNGVDTAHHRPGLAAPLPHGLVFNGAVTYAPNRDAMEFFVRHVLPAIRARVPDASLTITGERVPDFLDGTPPEGVVLTGHLADVRPAVAGSWACVVPLRTGGGTRVKILEAMALGTPVVSTRVGADGLDVEDGVHLLLADTAEELAAQTVRLLLDQSLRATLVENARRVVEARYDWGVIGRRLRDVIECP